MTTPSSATAGAMRPVDLTIGSSTCDKTTGEVQIFNKQLKKKECVISILNMLNENFSTYEDKKQVLEAAKIKIRPPTPKLTRPASLHDLTGQSRKELSLPERNRSPASNTQTTGLRHAFSCLDLSTPRKISTQPESVGIQECSATGLTKKADKLEPTEQQRMEESLLDFYKSIQDIAFPIPCPKGVKVSLKNKLTVYPPDHLKHSMNREVLPILLSFVETADSWVQLCKSLHHLLRCSCVHLNLDPDSSMKDLEVLYNHTLSDQSGQTDHMPISNKTEVFKIRFRKFISEYNPQSTQILTLATLRVLQSRQIQAVNIG